MMRGLRGALWLMALIAAGACAGSAVAQQPTAPSLPVIELFTSQGCSSCPPADRLLKVYAERKDVVALSYSVDYWDYLGWKDTLASPSFSERQRNYAKARGDGRVYTPQVVVDGARHMVGSDRSAIDGALKSSGLERVPLKCWSEGGSVVVETGSADTAAMIQGMASKRAAEMVVWLAVVRQHVDVAVRHGENRGEKLSYYNAVRELVPAGVYSGAPTTLKVPLSRIGLAPGERIAVLVQRDFGGPILGAAWMSGTPAAP